MRFRYVRYSCVITLSLALASVCAAQTAPADQQPAPAPAPAGNGFSAGPIDFSGLVDGYYSLNFNHPSTRNNNLRNFDVKANQFSLNMAKLALEHAPDPVGFKFELGFGKAFEIFHATEPATSDIFRHILQAYVSVKPASAKGLQLDFGKFVTSAGAEVTETHLNWNYSRTLLYANGPYYHFGLRTTMPLHKNFTAGFQLVNGWNNVEDNNTGKTVGFTGAFTSTKVSWFNNYYVGPEKTDTNKGKRHFYDTVLLLTPSPKANFYVNFDYGTDKSVLEGSNDWIGVAGAARFAVNEWFALSPRLEWYYDKDGFITGKAQKLKDFTMTGEFRMKEGFLTRLEYRRDWSDQPFFDRGNEPGSHKNQDTLLVGFVVFFGPKR